MLPIAQTNKIVGLVVSVIIGVSLYHHVWADDSPSDSSYLKNGDLKAGWISWHGSGELAFLKADGTEGAEGDPDVTPVIKIALSHGSSREVYQEYQTRDKPAHLDFKVDVFASKDFKRSSHKNDYTTSISWQADSQEYSWYAVVPNADFWIRGGPNSVTWCTYILRNLQPGNWTSVDYRWDIETEQQSRVVNFCVPSGEGTVYLKNPAVTQ